MANEKPPVQPQIEIMYVYEYARQLYRAEGSFQDAWNRIISRGAEFEKIYHPSISVILGLVEKFSGFSWSEYCEKKFPVYLAEIEASFPHPLTLAVREQPLEMLEDLIHQLAHRNMYFGFKSEELRDLCLQSVVAAVLDVLQLQCEEGKFLPVNRQSIKEYLK